MAKVENKYAGLMRQHAKQPEYEIPEGDPLAEPEPAPEPPPAPVETLSVVRPIRRRGKKPAPTKMQIGTYVTVDDFERLDALCEDTGKTKSRLFSEALALLFKHYRK